MMAGHFILRVGCDLISNHVRGYLLTEGGIALKDREVMWLVKSPVPLEKEVP